MGIFGAYFGCRGDGGFNGRCSGACSGDVGFNGCCSGARSGLVGFNAAILSCLVREKVLPVWPDGGREREKVRPARSKHPKFGNSALAGRAFSRKRGWRSGVGRVFRDPAAVGSHGANFVAP